MATKSTGFHFLWKIIALVLIVYFGICLLLFVAQRKMIYMPSRARSALPDGFEPWLAKNDAGVPEIWGFKRVTGSTNCLFFFHGNGGNASGWSHAVAEFPGDIFVLEYPGYGERAGSPTERSIKSAALRGFQAEHERYAKVVLSGQSLGTAVTETIFTRHAQRLHSLVLITPFLSLAEVAGFHYSWVPTRFLVRDRLQLFDAYLKFPGKSLVITAAEDEVIPRGHSLKYHSAASENRRFIELSESHNTIDLDGTFWERVLNGEIWK